MYEDERGKKGKGRGSWKAQMNKIIVAYKLLSSSVLVISTNQTFNSVLALICYMDDVN
jgi:hypothetical protein